MTVTKVIRPLSVDDEEMLSVDDGLEKKEGRRLRLGVTWLPLFEKVKVKCRERVATQERVGGGDEWERCDRSDRAKGKLIILAHNGNK